MGAITMPKGRTGYKANRMNYTAVSAYVNALRELHLEQDREARLWSMEDLARRITAKYGPTMSYGSLRRFFTEAARVTYDNAMVLVKAVDGDLDDAFALLENPNATVEVAKELARKRWLALEAKDQEARIDALIAEMGGLGALQELIERAGADAVEVLATDEDAVRIGLAIRDNPTLRRMLLALVNEATNP